MRAPDFNCAGCDARREIIFTRGQLGVPEAAIVTVVTIALLIAVMKGRTA
jgi:hypothetical protein